MLIIRTTHRRALTSFRGFSKITSLNSFVKQRTFFYLDSKDFENVAFEGSRTIREYDVDVFPRSCKKTLEY